MTETLARCMRCGAEYVTSSEYEDRLGASAAAVGLCDTCFIRSSPDEVKVMVLQMVEECRDGTRK